MCVLVRSSVRQQRGSGMQRDDNTEDSDTLGDGGDDDGDDGDDEVLHPLTSRQTGAVCE